MYLQRPHAVYTCTYYVLSVFVFSPQCPESVHKGGNKNAQLEEILKKSIFLASFYSFVRISIK